MKHNFRKLSFWVNTRVLVKDIYQMTACFPKEEQWGLTLQMRRAAVSVPASIAKVVVEIPISNWSIFFLLQMDPYVNLRHLSIWQKTWNISQARSDSNILKEWRKSERWSWAFNGPSEKSNVFRLTSKSLIKSPKGGASVSALASRFSTSSITCKKHIS